MDGEVLKACQNRLRRLIRSGVGSGGKLGRGAVAGSIICRKQLMSHCVSWRWPFSAEEELMNKVVPSDVPKGHVAVYVVEEHERHVIKISVLKHSLFQALLDEAHDCCAYDVATELKLCLPCDEYLFMEVVRCANAPQHGRVLTCI